VAWKPPILSVFEEFEDENRRFKQMYADLSLDQEILKDIVEKSCKAWNYHGN